VAPDGGTLVLVDPLVPAGDEDAFWRVLDGHVEHHGPPNVLIKVFFHARSGPLELLLLTHGAPVLADGGGTLARALDG
jgi:hypothetical protein